MKIFTLVYQCGIANVFDGTKRVHQGSFGAAELICYGARLAGAKVRICHSDVAGDVAANKGRDWKRGPGEMFTEGKRPEFVLGDRAENWATIEERS